MALSLDSTFPTYDVAARNQQFLDALEFVDDVIQNRQHMQVNVWRSMIQRSAYTLGEGLVKKSYRFHPGTADQRGLQRWRAIQISRAAAGADPGVDACAYNPYKVSYGFETVSYTGFQTERSTEPICIKDIRFVWQFRQQLALILGFLGDVTNSVWENYAREQYLNLSENGGNAYVLAEGSPNTHTFTYDPFAEDTDGDNTLTYADTGMTISTLNWDYLRWYSRLLQMQAPQASIGSESGRPIYGLGMDLEDWDQMIEGDAALREDWRYHSPETLISNYGTVTNYKGYALMHDMGAPRFKIKSTTASATTLKRIDPLQEDESVTIGNKVGVNSDYLNAEFGIATIFMNDVFKIEVPPAGPNAPGGGTNFGATPSLNGEFKWINEFDKDTNLLRENGFYFGRFEAFAKPLTYDGDAITFLYRRCPQAPPTECGIGDGSTTATTAHGEDAALASTPSSDDIDPTNFTITLTLTTFLSSETGGSVVVTKDASAGASTINGIIADASQAPTYTFALDSAPGDAAHYGYDDTAHVHTV